MVMELVIYTLHTFFGALLAGSVIFVAWAVVPAALTGVIDPDALATLLSRFIWLVRASIFLTLVTGGHLAGTLYTADTLTGTESGYLVLVMLGLWVGVAAVIEIGTAKARRGIAENKRRQPIHEAKPFLYAGALFTVGLLLVAGVLGANRLVGVF